jgi:hypothetical protein
MMAGTHDDAHVVSQLRRERVIFIETAQLLHGVALQRVFVMSPQKQLHQKTLVNAIIWQASGLQQEQRAC